MLFPFLIKENGISKNTAIPLSLEPDLHKIYNFMNNKLVAHK